MKKKEIGERFRYCLAVAWMNSLICNIWQELIFKTDDLWLKELNADELEKNLVKLLVWIGVVLLIIGLIVGSTWLLVICVLPLGIALFGLAKRGLCLFLDYFAGE